MIPRQSDPLRFDQKASAKTQPFQWWHATIAIQTTWNSIFQRFKIWLPWRWSCRGRQRFPQSSTCYIQRRFEAVNLLWRSCLVEVVFVKVIHFFSINKTTFCKITMIPASAWPISEIHDAMASKRSITQSHFAEHCRWIKTTISYWFY